MYNTYIIHDEWLNKGSSMNDWIYVPRRMNEYMYHDEFEQPSNCKKISVPKRIDSFIHDWMQLRHYTVLCVSCQ